MYSGTSGLFLMGSTFIQLLCLSRSPGFCRLLPLLPALIFPRRVRLSPRPITSMLAPTPHEPHTPATTSPTAHSEPTPATAPTTRDSSRLRWSYRCSSLEAPATCLDGARTSRLRLSASTSLDRPKTGLTPARSSQPATLNRHRQFDHRVISLSTREGCSSPVAPSLSEYRV